MILLPDGASHEHIWAKGKTLTISKMAPYVSFKLNRCACSSICLLMLCNRQPYSSIQQGSTLRVYTASHSHPLPHHLSFKRKSRIYIWKRNLISTVAADDLAPDGDIPSTGTTLFGAVYDFQYFFVDFIRQCSKWLLQYHAASRFKSLSMLLHLQPRGGWQ